MEDELFAAWIASHPVLLVAGILLGRRCPPGGVICRHVGVLRTAAITFGVCWFVGGFFEVLIAYGSLCCFCTGATYGISRRKSDLWPAIPVAILFGAGFTTMLVLWAFS
jgi:hypothetical protein